MSEPRKTYTERRSYSARVMKWRKAVYAPREGMTNGCRLLLLRLSDDMDGNRVVSVPRSLLAEDLGVAPPRITEWIGVARKLGFLDIVKRARQHTTAVYAGTIPTSEVLPSVPLDEHESDSQRYARADPNEVRPGVPLMDAQRYALGGSQEVGTAVGIGRAGNSAPPRRAGEERGCIGCGSALCDLECMTPPAEDDGRWTA